MAGLRPVRGGVRSNDERATPKTAMSSTAVGVWVNTTDDALVMTLWDGKDGEPDTVVIEHKAGKIASDYDSGMATVFRGTVAELLEKLSK